MDAELLTARQHAAVVAILSNATLEQAAHAAKVTSRTLRRWSAMPAFKAELVRQRSALIGDALTALARGAGDAAAALHEIATNPRAAAAARVAAARYVLELNAKFEDLGEIERRLKAVEQALADQEEP